MSRFPERSSVHGAGRCDGWGPRLDGGRGRRGCDGEGLEGRYFWGLRVCVWWMMDRYYGGMGEERREERLGGKDGLGRDIEGDSGGVSMDRVDIL